MDNKLVERIKANPKYHELVSKRSSFAVKLAIFVLVVYYGFVLVIAFDKEFFATKVGEVMTVAWPIAVAIIIIAFVTTLIYVVKANGEFEDLTNDIKNDVKDIL